MRLLQCSILATWICQAAFAATSPSLSGLRLATFDVDATPPIGSLLAYDHVTNKWDLGLRARGLVLLGSGEPIVLCAIDWIGLANESHDVFRQALAGAASTRAERVAIHALHQHDAPESDFSAEKLLKKEGLSAQQYESSFQRTVLSNLVEAVRLALPRAAPVDQVGLGKADAVEVASNRRIFGPDGKVRAVRYTACTDPALRAEPVGVVDPEVSLVSFWNAGKPLAVLSYFATHPQSYYRTGIPNPDFPGIARFHRQLAVPEALHVHFNGAGGNIGVGKFNDGSPTNRAVLAGRLEAAMRRAWENTKRHLLRAEDIDWRVEKVLLPPARHLSVEKFEAQLKGREASFFSRGGATRLAWVRRCQSGHRLEISCLKLGPASLLHLPGELFVEYQLAAKSMHPDRFVAMAAYGDYGPWYIGTAKAYEEGGYETGPDASNVGPEAEPVLIGAIRKLLGGR